MTDATIRSRLDSIEIEAGELLEAKQPRGGTRDFTEYRDDPVGFFRDVLRETNPGPWAAQEEIARAVRDHSLVVVQGCNSSGKDWSAARLALWWVYACEGFVLVTGPTQRQVREIVMGEVHRSFHRSRDLHGELFQLALRIDGPEQRGILAFTSSEASKLTGFHAPRLLTILTEAQAVEEYAWEGLLSCRTGDEDRTLAVGNPLAPEGRFYAVSGFSHWHKIRIPATDHPNVKEDRVVVPGGPTRQWIKSMVQEYGEDSPQYVARVKAEFPAQSEEALIDHRLVEAAVARFEAGELEEEAGTEPYFLGVDPAGPGKDATAVTIRQGPVVREYITWRKAEAPESAERIEAICRRLVDEKQRVRTVSVDEIGIGHGLCGILKRKLPGIRFRETINHTLYKSRVQARGVNVSKKPGEPQRFVRRKDELLWYLRTEFVEGRIALAPNEALIQELMTVRARQTPDGRIEIEPKDQMRARLGRSPDLLDSLMIAFDPDVAGGTPEPSFRIIF